MPIDPVKSDEEAARVGWRVAFAESVIRRIGFPMAGIAGIIYASITGPDPLLIATYLALAGYGGLPWVRDAAVRKEGT